MGPPTIVTVHDLVRLAFPYTRERTIGALGLVLDRRGIRRAAHVISVSGATKRDLMHHLGIPEERITVIHNGIDHSVFKPRREKFQSDNFRPYVLYVGSERPRKNLSALLRAFALLKGQGPPFSSLTLLKVGTPGRAAAFRVATLDEVRRLGIERQIRFVDHVSDEELAIAYSNAVALVYPSLYEGFGLPIVEAMACGCPVITSNVSSMPEVAGSAALLVDPENTTELAEALRSVILNQDLSASLRAKGLRRATHFSWDKTAAATFAVYQRIFASVGWTPRSPHEATRARGLRIGGPVRGPLPQEGPTAAAVRRSALSQNE